MISEAEVAAEVRASNGDLTVLRRRLSAAQRASEKASARRRSLPVGSSRARVTTANARWMRAAEARDRLAAAVAAVEAAR